MEELNIILDQVHAADNQLLYAKDKLTEAKIAKSIAEKRATEARQALVDYMQANGLKQDECDNFVITLKESVSVDVDIECCPEEFIRTKTTHEVDKAKIRALKVQESNWLRYIRTPYVEIKHKEA